MKRNALVFDAYGTLFDVHSVIARCDAFWPGQGAKLSQLWRAKQLEYTWLRSLMGRYAPFSQVTRDALAYACEALRLELGGEREAALMQSYLELAPYPDVPAALERLARGRKLAILTNGSPDMIDPLVAHCGMQGRFDAVLSVDPLRRFKPSPEVYQSAVERLGVAAGEIGFVSSNCWMRSARKPSASACTGSTGSTRRSTGWASRPTACCAAWASCLRSSRPEPARDGPACAGYHRRTSFRTAYRPAPVKYCSNCGATVLRRVPPGDSLPRWVCDQCGEIHYQNPKLVVGTVPEWDGRLLLCRRAIEPRFGYWTLPAGFMENDETAGDAAARETREEAGANIELAEPFTMVSVPMVNQVHLFFRARLLDLKFEPGEETLEVALFDEAAIPWNEIAFRTVGITLRQWFEDRRSGRFGFHASDVRPR